ncbi:MAG: FHA domain-containing protein [Desulfatitalea sp.]|nr:FHA domain-containing protein [Desulfatitalea sp.]NNK02197.1 FHA domain-containing protein [Desulfatitalea sp.]
MTRSQTNKQAILFADIADSTRLYDALGDAPARELIAHCLNLLSDIITAGHGIAIKTIGDEIMSTFNLPHHAASAAVQMQEQVSLDSMLNADNIQLRIGLHYGPVIQEEKDVYGDAVNVAARMVEQAKAGQIITTKGTLDLLGTRHQTTARIVDQTRIKGKRSPIDIYELNWGQPEELTMITTITGDLMRPEKGHDLALGLQFRGLRFAVNHKNPVINLGRDTTNGIVVNDPKVSRLHARIELRKDKFILVDQSTNGTYLSREDGLTALLRRDEIALPDRGIIGLGQKAESNDTGAILFEML